MAWDTALAQAIKGTSRAEANRKPQPWYRAEVVQVTPKLIFAIADKEFKFDSSTGLIMTATAKSKKNPLAGLCQSLPWSPDHRSGSKKYLDLFTNYL